MQVNDLTKCYSISSIAHGSDKKLDTAIKTSLYSLSAPSTIARSYSLGTTE